MTPVCAEFGSWGEARSLNLVLPLISCDHWSFWTQNLPRVKYFLWVSVCWPKGRRRKGTVAWSYPWHCALHFHVRYCIWSSQLTMRYLLTLPFLQIKSPRLREVKQLVLSSIHCSPRMQTPNLLADFQRTLRKGNIYSISFNRFRIWNIPDSHHCQRAA